MLKNYPFLCILFLLTSCKPGLKPSLLYGKWKYIKIESPNKIPADSVKSSELESEKPFIEFSKDDSVRIWWGGGVLSHGTFKVDGNSIRVKEILTNGKTREFPFWVSKITDKDLIFETKGEDGSRVTTVKE